MMEHHIRQVVDGQHYVGTIRIGARTFEFDLKFVDPRVNFGNMNLADTSVLFALTLKKGKKVIPLTRQEHEFFVHLLCIMSHHMYEDVRVRALNSVQALVAHSTLKQERFQSTISISLYYKDSEPFELDHANRAMLNAPKFDCKLPIGN